MEIGFRRQGEWGCGDWTLKTRKLGVVEIGFRRRGEWVSVDFGCLRFFVFIEIALCSFLYRIS